MRRCKTESKKMSYKETVFACEREGKIIRGTEYRPEGECLPVAVVCHGFMAFQDTVRQYAKALAELGYAAYCFDFCGGSVVKGKSDKKTTEMSVLTETRDLEAVLSYVKGLSYTDSERVLLMGCSQGGFVAALVAAKQAQKVKKLALFYPAFCIPDDARAGKMMFAKFDPADVPELIRCGPMKLGRCYVTDVIGMDPFEEIKGFSGEVLIVHGTKDRIVDLDYAKRAAKVYERDAKKVTFQVIKDGKHGFSKKHDAVAVELLKGFSR